MGAGSVQSTGPVTTHQQPAAENAPFKPAVAGNPGRLNRDSITSHQPTAYLGAARLYPQLEEKGLDQYSVTQPPEKKVDLRMTSPLASSSLNEGERNQFNMASRLIARIDGERSKEACKPNTRSEESHKLSVKLANEGLSKAKKLLNEAKELNRSVQKEVSAGGQSSLASEQVGKAVQAATDLLVQKQSELQQANADLKELQGELKQQAKLDRRALEAEQKLGQKAAKLHSDVDSIRSGIRPAANSSAQEISRHLSSVESALKKAKSAESSAGRLLASIGSEASRHGLKVETLRSGVTTQRSKASQEVQALKREVNSLKQQKKEVLGRERKLRQEQRADAKNFKGWVRKFEKADQGFEREVAKRTQNSVRAAKQTAHSSPVAPEARAPRARPQPGRVRPARSSAVTLQPLRPENANVKQFVAGVKPSANLSFSAIEQSIPKARTRTDFRQVLADIQASSLSREEKAKLRGYLSSVLLVAMKDPEKFKYLDCEVIEHSMSGFTFDEILSEYPKAVARDRERIDKSL